MAATRRALSLIRTSPPPAGAVQVQDGLVLAFGSYYGPGDYQAVGVEMAGAAISYTVIGTGKCAAPDLWHVLRDPEWRRRLILAMQLGRDAACDLSTTRE